MTAKVREFANALIAAGVNVRFVDGWESPAQDGYVWREADGEPAGHMHHHTASASYVPNRKKANAYAGLGQDSSLRLFQEDYGDGHFYPVFAIANAYPAPISSGAGDKAVLERVRAGIEVTGRQGPDTPGWYGNTHYWNTEWVLDGIGSHIDQRVWNMMVLVGQIQNEVMGWDFTNHISHGHHTRRKIDLWGGQFSDTNRDGFDKTMIAYREAINDLKGSGMWCNDFTDKTWMTMFHSGVPGVEGDGRYYCSNDGTFDFAAETGVAWGEGPFDGGAQYEEKVKAINHLMQGFAEVAGEMAQ